LCKSNFYTFLQEFWQTIIPEKPVYNWHIKYLCDELQFAVNRVIQGKPKLYDLIINVPPGSTKALDINTPVMTTWGWKKHGDLVPGDFVFGEDGKPKKVLAVTAHKYQECSKVTFKKMSKPIIAANTHLWKTTKNGIIQTNQLKIGERPDSITVHKPIEFPPVNLLIDPYLLGAWLGNGTATNGIINAAEKDSYILKKYSNNIKSYTDNFNRITIPGLSTKLRVLNLINNKHIPHNYLYSSIEQRMELLRGLMDTNGMCGKNGECSFTNKNKHVIAGFKQLLNSLGLPYRKKVFYVNSAFNRNKKCGPYCMISFVPLHDIHIFKLERKQKRIRLGQTRANRRYLKKVEPCGKKQVNCISVENGLYLAGKDMIVTHNSTICSIMLPCWTWINMPSARIIGGSHAHELAMDLSRKSRDIIRSDKFSAVFPKIKIRKDQDTKSHYINTFGGSRFAVSVGGSVTGMHGHLIIIDDPLDPEQAMSEVDLATANRWMTETLPTRKVNKDVTLTILIQQRLHQNDCSAVMLKNAEKIRSKDSSKIYAGVKHICLPAELTDDIKPKELAKYYVDGKLDPIRLNERVLTENRIILNEYGYAGQFLQSPVPLGGGMFKTNRIAISSNIPATFKQKVRFWDKAATISKKAAYTVGLLMAKDANNEIWILDIIRGRWDSSDRERLIYKTAIADGINTTIGIEQEPGSGGKDSADTTVRNLSGFSVEVDKPSGTNSSKELRADPFSVQVNNGNLKVKQAVWNQDFIDELKYFPYSTYKDQVDAASGAFNILFKPQKRVGVLF
jgi:predicted phage terminase large subunit-like protein